MKVQRAAVVLATAALLGPLLAALPAAAIPGELSVAVSARGNWANVNNSGIYPVNFSFPIDISMTSTGLRTFMVTIQFRYNVSLSETPETADGWSLLGPPSLTFQVPARGSISESMLVNGSVTENGSVNNQTLAQAQYNTQTNAPLISGGVGTVSLLLFLADAPEGGTGTGPSGGGGFLGSGAVAALGVVVAVVAVAVVVGVVFMRRRGKKVPGMDVVRKLWQRVRGSWPTRRSAG